MYASVDGERGTESTRPRALHRGLSYAGMVLGAAGCAAFGAALALHSTPSDLPGARARLDAISVLEEAQPNAMQDKLGDKLKDSCAIPEKWCHENPQRRDRLSYRDCDGDGILDPYCEGGELLRFGFIGSKDGCKDNWPNGLCSREVEATSDMASNNKQAAANEITIIHFNDVYNVAGVLEGDTRSGGMSRAVHVVKKERERNPNRTFVVFAGDALSPSVLSDLFEGAQMVDILNSFKLDAACLGNHEFDFGVDTLYKRLKESQFPWLNVNLKDTQDGKLLKNTVKYFMRDVPWAPRWDPEEAEPFVRVCFFGVAYDVRETMFKDVDRIGFDDVFDSAKEATRYLKEEKKCNVVVPLTHQFSKEDCQLSKELGTDVDLILGGHDHTTEFTSVCGHAPYAKAASDLKTQWVLTLWLSDQGKVESVDAKLLSMTDADPFDEELHNVIVKWEDKGEAEMGKKAGCLAIPLQAQNTAIRNRETNMGDFFTDAIREMHQVDVAMVNGGTMRGDKEYVAGELTKKTIVEMHPFGNAVVKIHATGKDIKKYINDMLECWHKQCGNFIQISGLKYQFDSTADKKSRFVKLMELDGSEVSDDKKLTVAMTDYMLANSRLKHNKLYDMTTLNDAVPIVVALSEAVKKADKEGKCVKVETDGRIEDVGGK